MGIFYNMQEKAIIVSAPSGAGKTSIVKQLLLKFPILSFSVSACSRSRRDGESDGKDYYFLTADEFREKIEACEFLEWEEVYPGCYYGTLRSEVRRIWSLGKVPVFDVDVKGGLSLKKYFKSSGLSIFIQPPSIEILQQRLEIRGTENPENLKKRVGKAEYELTFAGKFDAIVVNEELKIATDSAFQLVENFLR